MQTTKEASVAEVGGVTKRLKEERIHTQTWQELRCVIAAVLNLVERLGLNEERKIKLIEAVKKNLFRYEHGGVDLINAAVILAESEGLALSYWPPPDYEIPKEPDYRLLYMYSVSSKQMPSDYWPEIARSLHSEFSRQDDAGYLTGDVLTEESLLRLIEQGSVIIGFNYLDLVGVRGKEGLVVGPDNLSLSEIEYLGYVAYVQGFDENSRQVVLLDSYPEIDALNYEGERDQNVWKIPVDKLLSIINKLLVIEKRHEKDRREEPPPEHYYEEATWLRVETLLMDQLPKFYEAITHQLNKGAEAIRGQLQQVPIGVNEDLMRYKRLFPHSERRRDDPFRLLKENPANNLWRPFDGVLQRAGAPWPFLAITADATKVYGSKKKLAHVSSSLALTHLLEDRETLLPPAFHEDDDITHKGAAIKLIFRVLECIAPHLISASPTMLWTGLGKPDWEQAMAEFGGVQTKENFELIVERIKHTITIAITTDYSSREQFLKNFGQLLAQELIHITGVRGNWAKAFRRFEDLLLDFYDHYIGTYERKGLKYLPDRIAKELRISTGEILKEFFGHFFSMSSEFIYGGERSVVGRGQTFIPIVISIDPQKYWALRKDVAPVVLSDRPPGKIVPLMSFGPGLIKAIDEVRILRVPEYENLGECRRIERLCDTNGIPVTYDVLKDDQMCWWLSHYQLSSELSLAQLIDIANIDANQKRTAACMARYRRPGSDILDLHIMAWENWKQHIMTQKLALLFSFDNSSNIARGHTYLRNPLVQAFGLAPARELVSQSLGPQAVSHIPQNILQRSPIRHVLEQPIAGLFS